MKKNNLPFNPERSEAPHVQIMFYIRWFVSIAIALIIISCGRNFTPEQKAYISKIEKHRTVTDSVMQFDPSSPFNRKGKVEFHKLKYFDVDPDFAFKSKLYEFTPKDTITIYGTKGDPRKTIRYGYVIFNYQSRQYKINVYQGTTQTGITYFSIWFTDKTTNDESYGVGRYIEFEKNDDPNHEYEIDFNLAFNPYCAYSPNFSCAIPTKEDYIPLEIKAGEKKFHD